MRKERKEEHKNRACEKGLVKKDKMIGKGKKNRKINLKKRTFICLINCLLELRLFQIPDEIDAWKM